MGRHLLVASIAMLGVSAFAIAKPDHSNRGGGKPARSAASIASNVADDCPPGLKGKNPECAPPGRYKKLFEIGERVPNGYTGLMAYNALPYELRMGYGGALDPRARYVFDQQYIYRVDPESMTVRQILRSLR